MLESIKRRLDRLEGWLLTPWTGGIGASATLGAGVLASLFPDAIKDNARLYPFWANSLDVKATAFATTVVVVWFVFTGLVWAQNRAAKRARCSLEDQAKNFESLLARLETLPPEMFLAHYRQSLRSATNSALMGVATTTVVADVEQSIRNVLGTILDLARRYDKVPATVEYAANIMLWHEKGTQSSKDIVSPMGVNVGHQDYDGHLELIPALSTTTSQDNYQPDQSMSALALFIPVDKEPTRNKELRYQHPVAPGAPWAFVRKEYAGFPSIERLDEWLENDSSLDRKTVAHLREYFSENGGGKRIGGFASIPILRVGRDSETKLPLGVLNIHRLDPGLLAEKGAERFGPLVEPFLILLSILIVVRHEISSKKPAQVKGA